MPTNPYLVDTRQCVCLRMYFSLTNNDFGDDVNNENNQSIGNGWGEFSGLFLSEAVQQEMFEKEHGVKLTTEEWQSWGSKAKEFLAKYSLKLSDTTWKSQEACQ